MENLEKTLSSNKNVILKQRKKNWQNRTQVFAGNMERYRAIDIKLKLAIAENELELAKMERETRRRQKVEKKAKKAKRRK